MKIGPKEIYYTEGGIDRPIRIWFELLGPRKIDLGEGHSATQEVGLVHIESEHFTRQIESAGSDQLNLIYWLMTNADSTLQKLSGLTLSCIEREDIREDLDVFSIPSGVGIAGGGNN